MQNPVVSSVSLPSLHSIDDSSGFGSFPPSHCRWCGSLLCSDCSRYRLSLKPIGSHKRVCKYCFCVFSLLSRVLSWSCLLVRHPYWNVPTHYSLVSNKHCKVTLFLLLLCGLGLHALSRIELVQNIGGDLLQHLLRERAQHAPRLIQRVEDGA